MPSVCAFTLRSRVLARVRQPGAQHRTTGYLHFSYGGGFPVAPRVFTPFWAMFQGSGEIVVDIRLKRKDRTYRPNVSTWYSRGLSGRFMRKLPENAAWKYIGISLFGTACLIDLLLTPLTQHALATPSVRSHSVGAVI